MSNKFLNQAGGIGLAVVLLIATFFAWGFTKAIIRNDTTKEFDSEVGDITYGLQKRIDTYNDSLYALQGLFAASISVDRNEWSPFVKTAKIDQYPDVDFISYIQVVPDAEKQSFTTEFANDTTIRAQGYPSLKIYPEGQRNEYAVIKYMQPESDEAVKAYGFDLYSSPARKATLEKARDTNTPVASEKVSIVSDNSPGFIMAAPVYRNGAPTGTVEEKRAAIVGYVNAVFKLKSLFSNTFSSQNSHPDVVFAIYDSSGNKSPDSNNLLYANNEGAYNKAIAKNPKLSQAKTLEVGTRTWTMKFAGAPGFGTSFTRYVLPWAIALLGVSLSALLLMVFRLQGKKAEAKITASESRYRRLFEATQDGILIVDATTGAILDANPFMKELLGYPEDEIVNKRLWDIGIFKDIVASKADFMELKAKGSIHYEDLPLQTKNGHVVDVEFFSNIYSADEGQVIQCNVRDISQRRKAEQEIKKRSSELEESKKAILNVMEDLGFEKNKLEEAKAKDEAILSSIGDGLFVVDLEGKLVLVNWAFEEMLGWKLEEVQGKPFTDVAPSEDDKGRPIPPEKRPIRVVMATGEDVTSLSSDPGYYLVRKDKTRFPIAYKAAVVKLGGKTIGAVGVFRDVTKEKEIDKAKTEFVSVASHQLRTPLGIAKWYLEALQKENYLKNAPETSRVYLDEVYKSNERVLALVRDLLSVSRIDQGRVKDNPQSTDIIQLIKGVIKEMNIVAAEKNIRLSLTIRSGSLPAMPVDQVRLHEVIENLVTNAIYYNRPSGSVEVVVNKRSDDTLRIEVRDTGIGLSREDQKKLFTKFFRSVNGAAHKTEGSGLGLYVAQSYVKEWGGKIDVESQEGKGSIFTIVLPIRNGGVRSNEKNTNY